MSGHPARFAEVALLAWYATGGNPDEHDPTEAGGHAMSLTSAQLRRVSRKAAKSGLPYVTCETCGWTGFDKGPKDEWGVSPCPKCGAEYARYALPLPAVPSREPGEA